MMNKYKKISVIVMLVFIAACTDIGKKETLTYRIENTTDRQVSLFFFNFDQNGERILSHTEVIAGSGTLIERDLTIGISQQEGPTQAFDALLVEVVFDNERIEEHYNLEPSGRSIVDQGAYVNRDDGLTYSINLQNFENAVPCDGPCK